jgi:hypothetical protein
MEVVDSGSPHVFAFVRQHGGRRLLVLANFSEQPQTIEANRMRVYGPGYRFTDLVSGAERTASAPLTLDAYEFLWLDPAA